MAFGLNIISGYAGKLHLGAAIYTSVGGTSLAPSYGILLGVMEVLMVVHTKIPLSQEALPMLFLIVLLLVLPTGLFGKAEGSRL
jgi:branched-subunit amino acid ABC-type transport system permease component